MAVKLLSLAFLTTLLAVHVNDPTDLALAQPMSMFRDRDQAVLGYLLFALLLLIGTAHAVALKRIDRAGEASLTGIATLALSFVAITPSGTLFHDVVAVCLLVGLYAFFGVLAGPLPRLVLIGHLTAPVWLLFLTQFHSAGLFQKCVIVYFVLVANVHHHFLERPEPRPEPRPRRTSVTVRRRKVYDLDTGATWTRKPRLAGSSA